MGMMIRNFFIKIKNKFFSTIETIIPIIALTANVFKEDIDKCYEAGMNDHLGKPIEIIQIQKKLIHYIGKKTNHV